MLEKIKSPQDIKNLSGGEVRTLCAEIRSTIEETVLKNGGHLASNLGMVEATVALHRVFDSPRDSIVFDVGHQCYTHKLLTGRYENFTTLRTFGGISGFTNRDESEHDVLTAGHSGSALPVSLGIARANQLSGKDGFAVAVIGDGSFTNGMVYETVNSATEDGLRLMIVLNDNEMSISKNVGGIPKYFTRLRNSRRYFRFKKGIQSVFSHVPLIGKFLIKAAYATKESLKRHLLHINMFESMGLYYLGPVDGHDEKKLELVFREAMTKDRCTLVHMITLKGKGYSPAERQPDKYHFAAEKSSDGNTFSSVFGDILVETAKNDSRICAVTAAMEKGTGLSAFREKIPDRFFDMGIAEEAAVTFSGGLAIGGKIPVIALYSTFLQRTFDQLCEDIAMQGTHAVIAIDRAGLVPGDGITHQGIFDVSLLSAIPEVTLFSPETYSELCSCFAKCIAGSGLCALRYPKGSESTSDRSCFDIKETDNTVTYTLGKNTEKTYITYGRITGRVLNDAAKQYGQDGKGVRIIKLVRLLPLPLDEILPYIDDAKSVDIIEEGIRHGGIAEQLAAVFAQREYHFPLRIKAIDDFIPHGSLEEIENSWYCEKA